MGIFDWLKGSEEAEPQPSGMSRRDFFARVAGKAADGVAPEAEARDPAVLHRFHVAGFPFHDGPVLVPVLRAGMEFDLVPEPGHPTDPNAVRIERKRDHLGYVPPQLSEEVRGLMSGGGRLICRAARVSPNAELAKVLEVELVREKEEEVEDEGAGAEAVRE